MKITVDNFQPIEHAEIEVEGFTVLVGPSNRGKSSLVRSIKAAVTNKKGNRFVKKGANKAVIKIENQNHCVEWHKGSSTEYYIDGRHEPKAGRSTPKDEIAQLGLVPVSVGNSVFFPQILSQFDRPFIVSESSPTLAAELLSASRHTHVLTKAIKEAQKDLSETNSKLKVLEIQLKAQKILMDSLLPLEQPLSKIHDLLKELSITLKVCNSKCMSLNHHSQVLKRIKSQRLILQLVPASLPAQPPNVKSLARLNSIYTDFKRCQSLKKANLLVAEEFPTPVFRPDKVLALSNSFSKLRSIQILQPILKSAVKDPLPGLPLCEAQKLESLKSLSSRVLNLNQLRQDICEQKNQLDAEFQALEQEERHLRDEFKVCPVCSKPLELAPGILK